MRINRIVTWVLVSCVWSSIAFGQDQSAVATARQLGEAGLSAYDRGRYDEAAQKLLRAYQIAKVPTFARNAARALVKQGRIVAASELYLEATRLVRNEMWRGEMQQQAQREAANERAAVLPRIAQLKIVLEGASAQDTQVSLDGVVVPEALLGTERLTDPGKRHIVAKHGERTLEQDVTLAEGEHQEVTLRFPSDQAAPGATQLRTSLSKQRTSLAPAASASAKSDVAPVPAQGRRTQQTLGWVGIGVGAVGVVAGAGSGIAALLLRSGMKSDGCSDTVCNNSSLQGRVDTYNAMLTVSTVGFIVGGVGAAIGTTLLLTSPRSESSTTVSLLVTPGSVAVAGGF